MKVHEIFRSIQGEGKLAGTPMTFIRLHGCNLSCSWCDTPQDGYTEMSIEEIVNQVEDKWACLTGGEPVIHKRLTELAQVLRRNGYRVALETNGTKEVSRADFDWICVSPKSSSPNQIAMWNAHEIKLLVGSGLYNVDDLLASESWDFLYRYSLLPIWDDNYEANLKRAVELCQKYQVRLTFQAHKYLEIK